MSPETGGPAGAEAFAKMARALVAQEDVQQTLQKIVDLAVDTVEGCTHAGITFLRSGRGTTPAASDDVPRRVDAIQYRTGEGPGLDAIRRHEVFRTGDLGREDRWPHFAHRGREETAVRSMLCIRLFVAGDTLGALNLYSEALDAFDDKAVTVASVFAAHAAVALAGAMHDEQMSEALHSRDVIGQAKGILMVREGVTADQAFDLLRRASQHLNVKVRELAEQVAHTGATPEVGHGPPVT